MHIPGPLSPRIILCVALVAFACSKEIQREPRQDLTDGKYDSEFPSTPASASLSEISDCIFTVNSVGSYKTFAFDEARKVTVADLQGGILDHAGVEPQFSDNATRGTATLVFNDGKKMAFLTCAHNVTMSDTILSFYRGADRRPTNHIRTVAVKTKQFIYVSPLPEEGTVEVLVCDMSADVAVVGKSVKSQFGIAISPFKYRLGRAGELGWGTFTYVFSCPAGVKMVTRSLSSLSARDPEEAFFIDAVLGTGSSGGIVLAVRDGVPNYELVGMVRVVQARFSNLLMPADGGEEVYDTGVPYSGEVYVSKKVDLEYGVTRCISAEAIRKSLKRSIDRLAAQGYNLRKFAGIQE